MFILAIWLAWPYAAALACCYVAQILKIWVYRLVFFYCTPFVWEKTEETAIDVLAACIMLQLTRSKAFATSALNCILWEFAQKTE